MNDFFCLDSSGKLFFKRSISQIESKEIIKIWEAKEDKESMQKIVEEASRLGAKQEMIDYLKYLWHIN